MTTKYFKVQTDFNAKTQLYKYTREIQFKSYDSCVIESQFGQTLGKVLPDSIPIELRDNTKKPIYKILRKAGENDKVAYNECLKQSSEAFYITKDKITEHKLPMKLISTHFFLDRQKVLFNFTAEGRVDFRELVRDLAGIFKTRIELRQIGPRDETILLGGYGVCGRELCCKNSSPQSESISIQMAKDQNLTLNAFKISGLCNRLMCCIDYELAYYDKNKDLKTNIKEKEVFKRCENCANTLCNHYLEKQALQDKKYNN